MELIKKKRNGGRFFFWTFIFVHFPFSLNKIYLKILIHLVLQFFKITGKNLAAYFFT